MDINHGHITHTCPIKKMTKYKIIQVWVPKGTRDLVSNVQWPKENQIKCKQNCNHYAVEEPLP